MKVQMLAAAAILATTGSMALAQQSADTKSKGTAKGAAAKAVTVRLGQQNKSGETGSARLTPQGDQTRVEITLKGAPQGVAQPAHIHDGTCAKLDPKPKHGLENVVEGKSTTVVPTSLQSLLKAKTAINVHKSTDDIKTYVACGNIARAAARKK